MHVCLRATLLEGFPSDTFGRTTVSMWAFYISSAQDLSGQQGGEHPQGA